MRRLALVLVFAAFAARADQDNDLQLYRLGHPDALRCTRCDGSPGDPPEPGTIDAQMRFHMLASTLGLAFIPQLQEPAGTLGQAGFEIGFGSSQAFLRIPGEAWATPRQGNPPGVLVLPTVVVRKGLGASLELGVSGAWLARSQMFALSGEVRWAPLDGIAFAPDVVLRAYGTRVLGTRELDLAMAGADLGVSKTFGVAGMMKLQPYGQVGVALVNAQSSIVDFKPQAQNLAEPTAADGSFRPVSLWRNRYLRGALGVRLVTGVVVLGVEGALSQGTNDVQDAPPSGTPQQLVRLASVAGRLGFTF